MPKKPSVKSKPYWIVIWRASGFEGDWGWQCREEIFISRKNAKESIGHIDEWEMKVNSRKIETKLVEITL